MCGAFLGHVFIVTMPSFEMFFHLSGSAGVALHRNAAVTLVQLSALTSHASESWTSVETSCRVQIHTCCVMA